jgi:hypothetical protein
MSKAFISYRHSDGEWVWERLKPMLEAAGIEVLIDAERFTAGRSVVGQMDALQDTAQQHVLVMTESYLDSDYCVHEMDRAIAADPTFTTGNVIPIRRDGVKWPRKLAGKGTGPLFIDLQNDADDAPWRLLLKSCQGLLDVSPTQWLTVRDEVARYLQRDQSVNLVADGGVKAWRPLLEHLNTVKLPATLRTELKTIDLESGLTASRDGLLRAILAEFGHAADLPRKPRDLVRFAERMNGMPPGRLGVLHFDAVLDRHREYGADLFRELRNRVMEQRQLVLLVHSRVPYGSLLPSSHAMSEIDFMEVELRKLP